MTSVPLFLVDSFTTEVFRGNPAGVVLLAAAAVCGSSEAPKLPLQDKNEKTTTTVAEESKWIWSGVCSDSILQACASELNLSETVFLVPFLRSDENNKFDDTSLSSFPQVSCTAAVNNAFLIRWFTPDREVGLCGHATLAAAHILFTAAPPSFFGTDLPLGNVVKFFNDASGWVSVSRGGIAEKKNEEGNLTTTPHRTPVEAVGEQVVGSGEYIINFPLRTPYVLWKSEGGTSSSNTTTASSATLSVLGDICASVGLTVDDADEFCLHDGSRKYLLVVKGGVDVIQRATPNIATMREVFACCVAESSSPAHPLVPLAPLSLTITSRTDAWKQSDDDSGNYNGSEEVGALVPCPPPQVASRHFAPWVGIDEDPVTGAAHVVLVPYWLRRFAQERQRDDSSSSNTRGILFNESGVPLNIPLRCLQASKRGGLLRCTAREGERLDIEGSAVTFLSGTARLPLCPPKVQS